MSSLAYDDAAIRSIPASPRVPHEPEEVRRLHDKVEAAAELLIKDSRAAAPDTNLPDPRFVDEAFEPAIRTQSSLDIEAPERGSWSLALIPPLPDDDDDSVGLLAMAKLGFAVGLAAGVAYVVTSAVQLPGSGPMMARDTTAVLSELTQISSAQAGVHPNDVTPVAATAILAAAQANLDTVSAPTAASPSTAATVAEPVMPVEPAPPPAAAVAPHAAVEAAAPPSAPSNPTVSLARDEVAALMKRGRDLLAVGDIASARLILTRLADSGEADASLLLASTFDPVQLTRLRVFGAAPDIEKAREWYAKAVKQGSAEAGRRLQQSASR
jgi:hypothetical protein